MSAATISPTATREAIMLLRVAPPSTAPRAEWILQSDLFPRAEVEATVRANETLHAMQEEGLLQSDGDHWCRTAAGDKRVATPPFFAVRTRAIPAEAIIRAAVRQYGLVGLGALATETMSREYLPGDGIIGIEVRDSITGLWRILCHVDADWGKPGCHQFPSVSGKYGAPMGRTESPASHEDTSILNKVSLTVFKVRMVDGDYDDGGAYWGGGAGTLPLWCARGEGVELFVRALDAGIAMHKLRDRFRRHNLTFIGERPRKV